MRKFKMGFICQDLEDGEDLYHFKCVDINQIEQIAATMVSQNVVEGFTVKRRFEIERLHHIWIGSTLKLIEPSIGDKSFQLQMIRELALCKQYKLATLSYNVFYDLRRDKINNLFKKYYRE